MRNGEAVIDLPSCPSAFGSPSASARRFANFHSLTQTRQSRFTLISTAFSLDMQIPSPVSDLWRHRELLWQFTLRNIELRHKGSYLGLIWSFLNPLLLLGLYVFMFGHVLGGRFGVQPNETPIDFALGLFVGLSVFQMIAEVIGLSPLSIVT